MCTDGDTDNRLQSSCVSKQNIFEQLKTILSVGRMLLSGWGINTEYMENISLKIAKNYISVVNEDTIADESSDKAALKMASKEWRRHQY